MVNFTDFTDGGTALALDYVAGYAAGGGIGSDRRWKIGSLNYGVYNVLTYGADPTGVADSAPAFRLALGSDRVILVPAGTYLFKSTTASVFTGLGATALDIDGYSNFKITGYGATINIDDSISACAAFFISRCENFQIEGLTVNPSNFSGNFNPGFGLFSCVDFRITDITFGPELDYQAFFGDYLINGVFEHISLVHGQAVDMAYITHVKFDDIRADGGNNTPAGLCFGIAGDTASLAFNATGVTINQSEDVTFTRCNVTGYAAGAFIREGKNYKFSNNYWHDLDHPSISPAAIIIGYSTDVATPSMGFPVQGVTINGDIFSSLGATTPGFCIYIDPTAIVNADVISGITINNCVFKDIANIGIDAAATNNLAHLVHGDGNVFSNVTTDISSNFRSISDTPLDIGSINLTNPLPLTTGSLNWQGIATFAVANGGNTAILNKPGLVLLKDTNVIGDVGLYLLAPGGVSILVASGLGNWVAATTTPGGGQISVAWSGSDFRVYNNLGSSSNVRMLQIGGN